jgi:hypothetical protein
MIVIKGKVCEDADKVIIYFEPTIRQLTNMFLGSNPEKQDCQQELRIKIWELFKNEDRQFNTSYVTRRLKWDTINFINRNTGYNWYKTFRSIDTMKETEKDLLFGSIIDTSRISADDTLYIKEMICKAKPHLLQKQYEALVLFLSGAPTELIREFLGTRSRNMTRYYLLLAEAFAILREVIHEEQESQRVSLIRS